MLTPQRRTSSPVPKERHRHLASYVRKRAWMVGVGLACALIYWSATRLLRVFHWAESRVDRTSPLHMFIFFAVTIPFHLGLPIPIVHQAWAVAIGCFFKWRAFPILAASLSVGVPLPFIIGRRLRVCSGGGTAKREAWLRQYAPRVAAYLNPLRRAIGSRPIYHSFLLMWAPLPTSTLPLVVGFIFPPSELPLFAFVSGALPSKMLHFALDVLVGIEAGSLAQALDAHDDLPGVNDLPSSHRYARAIAIGTLAMTLLFMGLMVYTMHGALKELRAKQSSREDGNGCEQEHEAESLLVSWDGAKQQPPSPRLRISDGHGGDRAWGDAAV
jgi:hypothetical protein